ncbi:cytochrome c oxidase subunit II [Geothermobacter hydrogeniphilus]|uniref:Cytochrome c oxidase subunit 2 n=1 Tax=Geothermobacter hydrogeniphilus TaxID=1969733 RepID=A0A1X0Y3U2_9BACT|nr:cytochrome c oxidase subunit II [Geothermobacter hydrogeniphilus]ORJ59845.1 cytochrome c oxidase subunit II [Geothermobacter hydrogeniphilus]
MNPALITTQDAVDPVFWFILGISGVILLAITATMIWFVIRYRRSRCPEPTSQCDGNLTLEVIWIVVPTIIVLAMFYYGWAGYLALRQVPPDAMEVTATARMWSWDFEYANGRHSDRLYVPVGRPVKVRLLSKDVLHAFFVPAFRIKRDTVPGMENYVWFVADEQGSYDIFCAEYCGVGHADMHTTVEAVPPAEFEEWLAGMSGSQNTEKGRSLLARYGCLGCHSLDGSNLVGPSFKGLGGRQVTVIADGEERVITSDRDYIRRSLIAPGVAVVKGYPPVMPSYAGQITGPEVEEMIDYLLRIGQPVKNGESAESEAGLDGAGLARRQGCLGCHSLDGSRKVGPSFKGLFGRERRLEGGRTLIADEAYLTRAIRKPTADVVEGYPPVMPPYPQLRPEEVEAILEWLEGLTE